MRHSNEFMNKSRLDFIEIGSYDEEELAKLGSLPFRNVSVELDALQCLRFFPCVENLILRPGEISEEGLGYLRGLRIISLKLDYYSDCIDLYAIDLAQFPDLQFLFSRTQYNFYNIAMCQSLCTIVVQEWLGNDLTYLVGSSLRALCIFNGKLQRVEGIQAIPQIISLSIANQRRLSDVHYLNLCCGLESLAIEKCNRIHVSQIPPLPNLRYLELIGSQTADDLSFLENYPRLEYLLLGILVINGNMQVLSKLKHCAIMSDCKHYSIKNTDLPKAQHRFHSHSIPQWLEILPQAF